MRYFVVLFVAVLTHASDGGCKMVRCSFAPTQSCNDDTNAQAKWAKEGESCAAAYCYTGSYCDDSKVCRPTKAEGASCASIEECSHGSCTDHVCRS